MRTVTREGVMLALPVTVNKMLVTSNAQRFEMQAGQFNLKTPPFHASSRHGVLVEMKINALR